MAGLKKIPKISDREDPLLQIIRFLKSEKGGEFQREMFFFLNKMINYLWVNKDIIIRDGWRYQIG